MPSTIPYLSIPARRSQRPQGTAASFHPPRLPVPVLELEPLGLPMPLRTLQPAGSLGAPPPPPAVSIVHVALPTPEVLRPDFGRTRARDTAALRALAARVLPALERRRGFGPIEGLRHANDTGASLRPAARPAPPQPSNVWSLVVARVAGAVSEPPPESDPPGCA